MTDGLVSFDIRVPHRVICALSADVLDRLPLVQPPGGFAAAAESGWWWSAEQMLSEYSTRFTGRAPREVVTLLMALAQGHPIDGLLDPAEGAWLP